MRKRLSPPDCWIPEADSAAGEEVLLLLDRHRDGEIVASLGAPSVFMPGLCLPRLLPADEAAERWVRQRLRDGAWDRLLVPSGGRLWCIDTRLYLSTGYLLLSCCPVCATLSASTVRRLTESGMLGRAVLFEEGLSTLLAVDAGEEQEREAIHAWIATCDHLDACLPQIDEQDPGETVLELFRLSRESARLAGVSLCECPTERAVWHCRSAGRYDLWMSAAMLLTVSCGMSRWQIPRMTVAAEAGAEGIVLAVTADCPDADIVSEEMPEIAACRRLAEQNGQIFECMAEGDTLCLRFCTVRKDYALLGVKADPRLR